MVVLFAAGFVTGDALVVERRWPVDPSLARADIENESAVRDVLNAYC